MIAARSLAAAAALAAVFLAAACAPPLAPYGGAIIASEFITGGGNRVPFVLVNADGERLEDAHVAVRFFKLPDGGDSGGEVERRFRLEAPADFYTVEGVTPHVHDEGFVHDHAEARGYYAVGGVRFDETGLWSAEFVLDGPQRLIDDGVVVRGEAAFLVQERPNAIGVGERAPPTRNPTLAEAGAFAEVSTRAVAADALHDVAIADVLGDGKPLVVVFASPRFCATAICGPVTDMAAAVQGRFGRQAHFVHVEPWDLAAAEEGRLLPSAAMVEWRLPSEPWVFVVGGDGSVAARFEGLVSEAELSEALERALG